MRYILHPSSLHIRVSGFLMFSKRDMNLEDANSFNRIFGCFQNEIRAFIYGFTVFIPYIFKLALHYLKNLPQEPFFNLNIILRLNESVRSDTIENYFHLKGCDTIKNPSRY